MMDCLSRALHGAITCLLCVVVSSCGGSSGDSGSGGGSCDLDGMLAEVDRSMRDYYIYYDQVPTVDLAAFSSPEALVDALRVEPPDRFSRVRDTASTAALLDEGRFFGFGFLSLRDENDQARVAKVLPGSPFAAAGIERGDQIVSINGIDWDTVQRDGLLRTIGGTEAQPESSRWRFQRRDDGEVFDVDLTRSNFVRSTVLNESILPTASGGTVGYFAFDAFFATSASELDDLFAGFRENGITDLVVDFRYNGGGYVRIASQLSTLIAGNDVAGETLVTYRYNDKYQNRNFRYVFEREAAALDLQRVVFLVDRGTASASEIVVNSLKPYLDVIVIGEDTTVGKPFISNANDFCGKRLDAMEAEGFNVAGVSVAEGIAPDCFGRDDLTRQRGVLADGRAEGMLQAGLDFLADGSCDTTPVVTATRAARARNDRQSDTPEFRLEGAFLDPS